jgi:hypothetical protein
MYVSFCGGVAVCDRERAPLKPNRVMKFVECYNITKKGLRGVRGRKIRGN